MFKIPEEQLPSELKDEARLDNLFSPFRNRNVNPKDWDTKISSWRDLIYLYCKNNAVYNVSLSFLSSLFVRNGRPPSCLGVVLEELTKEGELKYLEDFVKELPQTWSGWAKDLLVKKPLSWSYNTLRRSLFSSTGNAERSYIHFKVVQEDAQSLLVKIPEKYINKVMNFNTLIEVVGRDASYVENLRLLLHYLKSVGKADISTLKDSGDGDSKSVLVKIDSNKVNPISEVDIGVYVLEQNEKMFTRHVEELEDQIAHCVKEVKAHLLKGHKQLAKTCLKKKHEMDKRLTRKCNALHNVQVLLERIRDVHTDADVWQAYKHALDAFDTTFKETGLSEDAVEDTVLKLGEMLDVHDDIQAAISRPVREDEGDLEEELDELMKEREPEKNGSSDSLDELLANLNLDSLPNVPKVKTATQEATSS